MSATKPPTFFATAADFRRWLTQHAATEPELLVGFYRVTSGRPSLTWPESVAEALCFGWIDGIRRTLDEQAYSIRFTPRRRGSIWSQVNLKHYATQLALGKMTPAGVAAFERRHPDRSGLYSHEQKSVAEWSKADIQTFKQTAAAWKYWQSCPPGYQKKMRHYVTRAKQPAARARRLAQLIGLCAAGKRWGE